MKYIISIISLGCFFSVSAQDIKEKLAEKKYEGYSYIDAIAIYEKVAEKGYTSIELFQKLGDAYYFNGIEGPNGEKISFKKVDTCCPFPTKNNTMGAGTIGIYEVTFEGSNKKTTLYFNIYEKGKILCPKGFSIKKSITEAK